MNLILRHSPPFIDCTHSKYSGLEFDLLFNDLGYKNSFVSIECQYMSQKDYINYFLSAPENTVGLGKLTYTLDWENQFNYTFPVIRNKLSMIANIHLNGDMFGLLKVIDWGSLTTAFIILIIVGLLIPIFVSKKEVKTQQSNPLFTVFEKVHLFVFGIYNSIRLFSNTFEKGFDKVQAMGLMYSLLSFGFFFYSLYLSILIYQHVKLLSIHNIYSLNENYVLTAYPYDQYLASKDIIIGLIDEDPIVFDDVKTELDNHIYFVFLYDWVSLHYFANAECNYEFVDVDDLIDVSTRIIFSKDFDDSLLSEMQNAVLEHNNLKNYLANHVAVQSLGTPVCTDSNNAQAKFVELTGLWIILGCVYLVAFVLRHLPTPLFKPISKQNEKKLREMELQEKIQARSDKMIGVFSNLLQKNYVSINESIYLLKYAMEYKKKMEESLISQFEKFKSFLGRIDPSQIKIRK